MESDASSTDLDERETRGVCQPCAHDRYNNNVHKYDDFSDSEYDEALTCNVCDRSFSTRRELHDHQQKKRHFGCSACDSLFPSRIALEQHRVELEHGDSDSRSDSDSDSDDSRSHQDCRRLI